MRHRAVGEELGGWSEGCIECTEAGDWAAVRKGVGRNVLRAWESGLQ